MNSYLKQKLLAFPAILLLASFLVFAAVRLLPGDPARIMAGMQADQATIEAVRVRLGLDKPFFEQYAEFLIHAAHGDFGTSIRSGKPVKQEIAERFPYTLALTTTSYCFAIVIGLSAGLLASASQGRFVDHLIISSAVTAGSIPNYWLALMAMTLFCVHLGWLPLIGAESWRSYVLPSITLGLLPAAVIARMSRASLLEILHQDYIRTARAKGLSRPAVYLKHALKNALVPIVTIIGMNFAGLLGGAVITEAVFSWPGIGRLIVDAVHFRDYAIIQGVTLLTVFIVIAMNLLTDVLITILNPRIRLD